MNRQCCDNPIPPNVYPGYAPKSRAAYIHLAYFLGGLGVHNFYAGYIDRGIAQLAFFIINLLLFFICFGYIFIWSLGIWVLVEIFTVNTDANGVPMV